MTRGVGVVAPALVSWLNIEMSWLELRTRLEVIGNHLKREIRTYQLILKDRRTPRGAKWLLGIAVGYALLPFDLIPDFIPVIGHLDDLIIVPALIIIALKMVPREVVEECRHKSVEGAE